MSTEDDQRSDLLIHGSGSTTSTTTNPRATISPSSSSSSSGLEEILRGRVVREEAVKIMMMTSRALSRGAPIPSSSPIAPLCTHLKSLQSLLPHTASSLNHRSSCVIMDTLVYLNQMKDKIMKLKAELKSTMIEVKTIDIEVFQVHVHCKARNGIMENILEALEGLELMFDNFDMRYCDGKFDFKAQCTFQAKDRRYLEVEVVKEALQKAILRPKLHPTTMLQPGVGYNEGE